MKLLLFFLSFSYFISASEGATPTLKVAQSVALTTLEPSEAEDFVTVRVLSNLGTGLTRLNASLKPEPGLAKSWDVSADNLIYTFNLKEAQWSDGTPIVADDFLRAFEHTFSPTTVAKLALPAIEIVKGAKEYKAKETADFNSVGIKAPNPETIVIQLNQPAPYFLGVLSLPCFFPEHPQSKAHKIEVHSPTSGSYTLEHFGQDRINLKSNPKALEPAQNDLEFIVVKEQTTALSLYKKGEIDFLDKIPSEEFKEFEKSPEMHSGPWLSTYYLGFNVTKAPFDKKSNRRAFVQAVNRKQAVSLLRDFQKEASSLVPSPLAGSSLKFGPDFSVVEAKKSWDRQITNLDFFFDGQEKNTVISAFIQQEVEKTLKVHLKLHPMEWKSYLSYLKESSPPFFRFAWLATFPDPLSHLQIFLSHSPNNYTGYKNPVYDKLVEKIAVTPEGSGRRQMIAQAQKILLTDDVVIMPIFHYTLHMLIRNRWKGLALSPMGIADFHRAHL